MIKAIEKFLADAGVEEAAAEAKLLVTCVSELSLEEILCGAQINRSEEIWQKARRRAETGEPIQHIIGFSYFMGDKFKVNKDVLIPRPETELLVRSAIEEISELYSLRGGDFRDFCVASYGNEGEKEPTMNVLDIGTGTGCIAIEIAKNLPEIPLEIMGVDISTAAIQVAIDNMNEYNLERRVVFRKSDIFSTIRSADKFDVIVSNPPYIPLSEEEGMQNEVKNFEPRLALFTEDENGIEFYKKILEGAKPHLKRNSRIIFELGLEANVNQAEIVAKIAEKLDYKVLYTKQDLIGIERVITLESL